MKLKVLSGIAVIALAGPLCAQAGPVTYDVAYNASSPGSAGSGSFGWDADTSTFTSFNWDFGGVSGALPTIDWNTSAFGGVLGRFLFEVLTGEDVHSLGCSGVGCGFSFGMDVGDSFLSAGFTSLAPGVSEYSFWLDSTLVSRGTVAVSRDLSFAPGVGLSKLESETGPVISLPPSQVVAVPAPATVGLLGIGLLGFVFGRKAVSRTGRRGMFNIGNA